MITQSRWLLELRSSYVLSAKKNSLRVLIARIRWSARASCAGRFKARAVTGNRFFMDLDTQNQNTVSDLQIL